MKIFRIIGLVFILCASVVFVSGQSTAISYQGNLAVSSTPGNGNFDFEFRLFDALSGGTQLGPTLSRGSVPVTGGNFSVSLDFGSQFPGSQRYLEISVREAGAGQFTALAPRHLILSTPYSIKSIAAENAETAATATNAQQLGGVAANQYVLTGDPRMTDARSPLPNSPSYIQNTSSPQSSSNFNISGTGTANAFTAATQFNIGGNRVLGSPGAGNLFVGIASGAENSGINNSFVGQAAGSNNLTGAANSFFGRSSGLNNTTGHRNAFFGILAGSGNSEGGSNTFLGDEAGTGNTVGNNNTAVGSNANVAANNLSFATALGSGAVVSSSNTVRLGRTLDTVQIPGALAVGGALMATLPAGSSSYIQNQNAGAQASSNFNISGTGTANIFNAATQFNIGGSRVLTSTGSNNLFAGVDAGNTGSGSNNSMFGFRAGFSNSSDANSFFGVNAGYHNVTGFGNSAFGWSANFGAGNLSNATAIGFRSFVTQSNSLVLGSILGINEATSSTNVGIGTTAPLSRLDVRGDLFVGLSAVPNAPFLNSIFLANDNGDANNSFRLDAANNNLFLVARSAAGAGPGAGIIFRTGNAGGGETDRMVINSLGGVGIGTTSPTEIFHIATNGGNARIGGLGCATGFVGITFSTQTCFDYSLKGNGVDTILNAPPSGSILFRFGNLTRASFSSAGVLSLSVLGSAGGTALCRNASSQISDCSSSMRYKSNINSFTAGLELIRKLNPVSFTWKDGGMHDVGLVAEDVANVEPLLTTRNSRGEIEGVKYDRVGVLAVNAIKEQQAQIEEQKKEIDGLRQQIEALKKLVCTTHNKAEVCNQQK